MRLFELAFCCRLYAGLTTYDSSLAAFRQFVAPGLEPSRADHRAALFQWLNAWGCRQFAREHHATTASKALTSWADRWILRLPAAGVHLTDLSPGDLESLAAAYGALKVSMASRRTLSDGRLSPVTFGPTGAAKTLFALRPNAAPPWDDPIRAELQLDGSETSFLAYLMSVADQLRHLESEAGVPASALPELIGRPESSAPKLIDEYNWVVMTRGLHPPDMAELAQWGEWARRPVT